MHRGRSIFGADARLSSLRSLRAFEAVARLKSVGRASHELLLSQPAVSRAIAKLEQELGFSLLVRSHVGTTLTECGTLFKLRTERFFSQLHDALLPYTGSRRGSETALSAKLTMPQAETLAALAKSDSLQDAATNLAIPVSHLRRVLRSLEHILGERLLQQTGQDVALTERGAELARRILLASRDIEDGIAELAQKDGRRCGRIIVGALPAASSLLLASPLNALSTEYPVACVQVLDGMYEDRLKWLRSGMIDVMIAHLAANVPDDVVQEPLFHDRYVIVVRAGHPLASGPAPTKRALAAFEWILPEENGRRLAFENLFAGDKSRPAITLETYSRNMTRAMLAESNRVSILSQSEVIFEERGGQLTALPRPHLGPPYALALLTRKNWLPTQTHLRLLELMRAHTMKLERELHLTSQHPRSRIMTGQLHRDTA